MGKPRLGANATDEKSYQCGECGKMFSTEAESEVHIRDDHSDTRDGTNCAQGPATEINEEKEEYIRNLIQKNE